MVEDLVYRLRKRAEIRRQIPTRKSVQNNEPDRLADLLEEAANALEKREWADLLEEAANALEKREWVGLSDEDVTEAFNTAYDGEDYGLIGDFSWFAELIEAKLKEKNT